MEVEACGWEGPVGEEVEFAEGGAVAMWGEVMPNILNAIHEEFAFVEAKADPVLDKGFADTLEE